MKQNQNKTQKSKYSDPETTLYAHSMGGQTLIGVNKSHYPVKHGNCFDVNASDGNSYRIVNFSVENWEEMIKRKKIELPIQIEVVVGNKAIVKDCRIPPNWYNTRYCEVCCPESHLPINQKTQIELERARGERIDTVYDNGVTITKIDVNKRPDFRTQEEIDKHNENLSKWTFEVGKDIYSDKLTEELMNTELAEEWKLSVVNPNYYGKVVFSSSKDEIYNE